MTLTADQRAVVETYRSARAKRDRLDAAENRSFGRYMDGTGSAATARKAKSRADAHSTDFHDAESAVYRLMDELSDDGLLPGVYHADPARFAEECQEGHHHD